MPGQDAPDVSPAMQYAHHLEHVVPRKIVHAHITEAVDCLGPEPQEV